MMQISFVDIIEFIGTFAFAISGIRLASAKQFDLFGAFVVGLVTAIGGGTIRDLLLDVTPFWMSNPIYLVITALALLWDGQHLLHLRRHRSGSLCRSRYTEDPRCRFSPLGSNHHGNLHWCSRWSLA